MNAKLHYIKIGTDGIPEVKLQVGEESFILHTDPVDVVEVVWCKHCKNKYEHSPTRWFCGLSGLPIDGNDFCSRGEQICNFCITKKDGG